MTEPIQAASFMSRFGPPYLAAGVALLVLYSIQAEVRFGKKARASKPGASDRGSTRAISLAVMIPVIGLVMSVQSVTIPNAKALAFFSPSSPVELPGMPALAWWGVAAGALGLVLRLWAVLVMRERYTRTLLVQDDHTIERGGPYRFVRHPGYLGSLLTLNAIAVTTGNAVVIGLTFVALLAAYAHRVRAEDAMLVETFGDAYASYRREVKALVPFVW